MTQVTHVVVAGSSVLTRVGVALVGLNHAGRSSKPAGTVTIEPSWKTMRLELVGSTELM